MTDTPPNEAPEGDGGEKEEFDAKKAYDELTTKYAEMEKELEGKDAQIQMLLSQPPGVQQQQQAQQRQEAQQMPSFDENPEAFMQAWGQRVMQGVDQRLAAFDQHHQTQQQDTARYDALWNQFSEKNPELAENRDLVEFMARKAVTDAAARGWDVERYMFGQTDRFFDDVSARMKSVLPGGPGDDDDKPDRGGGLLEPAHPLGIQHGAAPPAKPGDKPPTDTGFLSEMRKTQRDAGLLQ